jgi:hypothetical protein
MKPCNNCDKKPDCRVICKEFSKWLDDDSPDGPILENRPIKLNLWCGRNGHYKSTPKSVAPAVDKNKATGKGSIKGVRGVRSNFVYIADLKKKGVKK